MGSEGRAKDEGPTSSLPVFCSLLLSLCDAATDDPEERFAGFPTETDLWANPWEQSKIFAGFVFLGWFIWQGPILYIIFRVSKPFSSAKVSLRSPRRNRREPMYVICNAFWPPSSVLLFIFWPWGHTGWGSRSEAFLKSHQVGVDLHWSWKAQPCHVCLTW